MNCGLQPRGGLRIRKSGPKGGRFESCQLGDRRRHDTPEGQGTEEALAAWRTPVRRKRQPSLHAQQRAPVDPVAREMFQIKIPALRAVRIARKCQCYPQRIKAIATTVAPPRLNPPNRKRKVQRSLAVRTEAIGAAALRADHPEKPSEGRSRVGRILKSWLGGNIQPSKAIPLPSVE
jgi:hypothetical protein